LQRMVYFPIKAIARPFGFNAGNFATRRGISPIFDANKL
jgi:hypothetical protein